MNTTELFTGVRKRIEDYENARYCVTIEFVDDI